MFVKNICTVGLLLNRFVLIQSISKMTDATKEFPKTLTGFGYGFNNEGKLRKLNSAAKTPGDMPFDFNVSKDAAYNQRHYEALGDVITEHVYDLLETEGFQKIYVPDDVPSEAATFVFATKQDLSNVKKLLVLIHGSGVVRAGQWARSLIINQSLSHGTQIPYIQKAKELDYDVLVLNTNDNYRNHKRIAKNGSPIEHAEYVFGKFIEKNRPEAMAIVAHSYGGHVAMSLAKKYADLFKDRVFALGLTDSVNSSSGDDNVKSHLTKVGRHWVASDKPLNSLISAGKNGDIQQYSAGHGKHEWTSWACMDALFEFFEDKYSDFSVSQPKDKKKKLSDEL